MKMDLFLYNSKQYSLVINYYSNSPWVQKLSAPSTEDVISALSVCFSVLGTPGEVICDYGTICTSMDYKKFATKWGFTLSRSYPYYQKAMVSS